MFGCWIAITAAVLNVSSEIFSVFASLVHALLQTLAKVSNNLCHWLLMKFVPDLLQCGSKFCIRWWFFLACRRLLAWRPTCDSQQQYNSLYSMFLLSQRLQWNFTHVTNAQQLALKIYQVKRINFSTSTFFTNFTSQWRYTDTVFRQVPRFLSISAWMQMLKIKLWRGY